MTETYLFIIGKDYEFIFKTKKGFVVKANIPSMIRLPKDIRAGQKSSYHNKKEHARCLAKGVDSLADRGYIAQLEMVGEFYHDSSDDIKWYRFHPSKT